MHNRHRKESLVRTLAVIAFFTLALTVTAARANTTGGGGGGVTGLPLCVADLMNCQNPAMYQDCSSSDTAPCADIINQAFADDNQAIPNQRMALAPPGTVHAGQVVPTKYYAFDPVAASLQLVGATDGYRGSALNHRAWVRNPSMNGRVVYHYYAGHFVPQYYDPQAPWASDGTRVNSCEEYAYKRYRSMSNYEDYVAGVDALDYMHVLGGAYSTGFIFSGNVTDEAGNQVMTWSVPPHAKNIYFELPIDNLPLRTYEYNNGIASVLRSVGTGQSTEIPTDALGLYDFVFSQTNRFGADLLEQRYDEMKRFRELMRQRAQLVATDPGSSSCTLPFAPQCILHQAIVQAVYYADQALDGMLWSALEEGCLDQFDATACDLSPHQLVDEIHEAVDAQREPDYQRCVQLTGNQFGSGSFVANVSNGGLASVGIYGADWASSTSLFNLMLSLVQRHVSGIDLPVDPKTGKYTLGDEKSDHQSWGSQYFGADYSYDAAWHVTDLAAPDQICNANLHMNASLSVNGSILTKSIPVVDFMAAVDTAETTTSDNSIREQSHFKLLGSDVYTPLDQTQPLNFDIALGGVGTGDKTIWESPPLVIPIGPIDIFVSGGISGGVGVDGGLSGGLSRDCSANTIGMSANSNLQPYAHLEGFAQAALGVPSVLEVGVRGSVTLLRASLPLNAGLKMALDGSGQVTLSGGSSLYLDLTTFGGQISVFLDSLLGSTEKELISWKGYQVSQKLFDLSFADPVALSLLQLKLAEPPGTGTL